MSDLRIRMSCLLEFAQRSKEVCWMSKHDRKAMCADFRRAGT